MNIKDLILPMILAFIGTIALHYFVFDSKKEVEVATADKQFLAPKTLQILEPFDLDINFSDAAPRREKETTTIQLPYGTIQFSNDGAVIDFLSYKHQIAGKPALIETLIPSLSKEQGAFLVALDGLGKTPYYYDLIENKEQDKKTILTYKGSTAAAIITKQFIVYHDLYRIDLMVTIEPQGTQSVRPRILFPSPRVNSCTPDSLKAVTVRGGSLEKTPIKDLMGAGTERPTLFGLEDTYFAHVLYQDPDLFAQRAYLKQQGENVQAILQSQSVTEKKSWTLSFYVGPQEMTSLSAVDPRLEGLLSYGWFSPISKLLLALLIFFYGLFGNYGVAIIVLTLLMRLILVPFTPNPEQTRKKSAEAQKKLAYIEQKYRDNPDELQRAKTEYARKHAVPGILGCLPLLLQLPVFIGLQRVLSQAFELYQAPFLWITDLSRPDPLYILPLLVGVGLSLQLAQMGDVRQRLANVLVAIIVAAVSANLSAGLALFICVSTLLGLAQSYIQKAYAL